MSIITAHPSPLAAPACLLAARVAELHATIAKLQAQVQATEAAVGTPPEQRKVILDALNKALADAQLKLAAESENLPAAATATGGGSGATRDPAAVAAILAANPDHPAPGVIVPPDVQARLDATLAKLRQELAVGGGVIGGAGAVTNSAPTLTVASVMAQPGIPAARIYVGSLHYDLGEKEMRAIFAPFGAIARVDMSHEPSTGRSKGYCFITFEAVESAQRAIDGMNGMVIAGRPIKVSRPAAGPAGGGGVPGATGANTMPMGAAGFGGGDISSAAEMAARALASGGLAASAAAAAAASKPAVRVYVGSVPQEFTPDHIRAVFGPFGAIRSVTLLPPSDPGSNPGATHRGYGFIEFEDEACAKAAIEAMNGFEIAGRRLRVNFATSSHGPGGGGGGGGGGAMMSAMGGGMMMGGGGGMPAELAGKGMLGALGMSMPMAMTSAPGQPPLPGAPMYAGMMAGGMPPAAYGGGGANMAALAAQAAAVVMPQHAHAQQPPLPGYSSSGPYGVGAAPPPLPPPPPPPPSASYAAASSAAAAPSRVMVLLNMVGPEEAGDPSLPGEVAEECAKYGPVEVVRVAVRPGPHGTQEVGVFAAFRTPAGAAAAVVGLHNRYFGGRVTTARPYSEAAFYAGDLQQPPL